MGALAVAHLQRLGVDEVVVVNRTPSRASQLAARAGSEAVRAVRSTELVPALTEADVLLACTTSPEVMLSVAQARAAAQGRGGDHGPLVICDLGLPRNVDPAVAAVPGVVLLDLQTLRHGRQANTTSKDVDAARGIVSTQLDAYRSRRQSAATMPAVVSLREDAAAVVHAELSRLQSRLPGLDPDAQEEVARAVHRVAAKLLHASTIALKQLPTTGETSCWRRHFTLPGRPAHRHRTTPTTSPCSRQLHEPAARRAGTLAPAQQ